MPAYVYTPLPPAEEVDGELDEGVLREDELDEELGYDAPDDNEHDDGGARDGEQDCDETDDGQGDDEWDEDEYWPKQLFTRLLTIYEGEFDDDIELDLEVVDLGQEKSSLPEYEVLSYVWGSEERPYTVFVGEHKGTIPITTNLDQALRHLRYPDRPRYMWIDGLCIDQGSTEERSRQVAYMSHIYWESPAVLVWLGPSADNSDLAMDTLEFMGSRIEVDWKLARITGVTKADEDLLGLGVENLPLSERQCIAILTLMQRPWFERIWIRQEVFKADDMSSVMCGSRAVSWGDFRRGLYCCIQHQAPSAITGNQRKEWWARCTLLRSVIHPNTTSLLWLRFVSLGSRCTDPRDRIYGLLGLLDNEEQELDIVPDYSKTAPEVFQDVALLYLEALENLDLLRACGRDYTEAPPPDHVRSPIPSWVPDWSVPQDVPRPLRLYRVFCPFKACTKYLRDGILRAAGTLNGTVQEFIELDVSNTKTLAASIRALVPGDATDKAYPGGGNMWDAYRIALCAEYFGDRTEPPDVEVHKFSHLSLSIQGSKEAIGTVMAAESLPKNNFLHLVYEWNKIGKFFTTREGYIGWGPKATREGDQIVSLLGFDLPVMIRHSSDLDGKYFEVLGPCYLQGFMFGEAFLGPLPDWLQPVYHVGKTSLPEFHDSKTGEIAVEDPRLSSLPVDLGDFREEREVGWILRLDIGPEIWRARGVEVVDFDLI
ncbi:hypothetical protein VMCG_06873 [Cytospora schulzeri]|uniref:Heterokaryon incompatibility domain-containing protein n=1 Tax=Cytospora schulzeri TaxID=448051 RepID=A0A423W280_9PEZI|nr:hypothetical protein VMCG_06873 [Valsa malicola]